MILSPSISASSYYTNFIFLLKSSINMLLSITGTMHLLAPQAGMLYPSSFNNLLLIFQISTKVSQPQQCPLSTLKVLVLILHSLSHGYNLKYLCRYCINIYIIYHTVGSMKTGPPFYPPPTHTNILAATRIGYSSVLL